MSKDTLFTTESAGASEGSGQYVQDVFRDVVLPASNNTGLTDNATTNPIGALVGNADVPRYAHKTLWVKDLVLIEDRSKWVSGAPTYRIIWHEDFPAAVGYFSPDEISGSSGDYLRTVSYNNYRRTEIFSPDGCRAGVTGKIRRMLTLSGSGNILSSVESNDLHTFTIGDINFAGVVVYYENATTDVAAGPGTTYVNKTAATTTSETNVALPGFGSSLGGVGVLSKASGGAYSFATTGASTVTSIAQGSIGTNLLNVSLNHGASFPAGSGIVVDQGGGSYYVGGVQSVSTDTLTVYPTLPFGISQAVYRSWVAGQSLAISATTMYLADSIDFSAFGGLTTPFFDGRGKWAAWATNCGITTLSQGSTAPFYRTALGIFGQTGYINVQGQFSAAEFEVVNFGGGGATFGATISINGVPAFSIMDDTYGIEGGGYAPTVFKQTVFSEAGGGWNAFNIGFDPATAVSNFAITKVNLYRRRGLGASYGNLAALETFQAFADRSLSATLMALGTAGRVYGDQLQFVGNWSRTTGTGPSQVEYRGSTTNCTFTQYYYGKNFAILGTAPSGATLALDGAGIALTFNQMISVASEGWHTVAYSHRSGTSIIQAFDFTGSRGEIRYLGTSAAVSAINPIVAMGDIFIGGVGGVPERLPIGSTAMLGISGGRPAWVAIPRSEVFVTGAAGFGSINTTIRRLVTTLKSIGTAITYTDSATAGASFTINEDGIYTITYQDESDSSKDFGISLNSNQLTTPCGQITNSFRLGNVWQNTASAGSPSLSVTTVLRAGDIIRPHANGNQVSTNDAVVSFRITKVSP